MRSRLWLFVLVVGLGVAGPTGSIAQTAKVAIVPLSPLGISDKDAQRVERWITAAMMWVPGYKWNTSSKVRRMIGPAYELNCDNDAACYQRLLRKLSVDLLVTGDVGSLGGAYMLYLRLRDPSGAVVRSVSDVLDPTKNGLRNAARSLAYRLLKPEKYSGTLHIKADVPNAWIYLNGRRIAKSPTTPIKDIPVGTHALRVTHEAYKDFARFVDVQFNQVTTVKANLSAFPVRAKEMRLLDTDRAQPLTDAELPWYRRWWTVATLGAVIFAVSTVTAATLTGRPVERDSEAVVRP